MAPEDFEIKAVRQIIPSSGHWLREVHNKTKNECLRPVVAIALVDVTSIFPPHFLDQAVVPVTSDDVMYGAIARTPYLGLLVTYSIFHDVDFEELGVRLKDGAEPRSHYTTPAKRPASPPDCGND